MEVVCLVDTIHQRRHYSEYTNYQTNLREKSFFTISGLKRLPAGLAPKEWQERALCDVQGVLTILMGKEYPIVFVQNGTSKRKDAPSTYHVLMKNLEDSKAIWTKFGSFFLGGKNAKPPSLKDFNIKNRVTAETKTRINILKLLAKKYRESNPDGKAQVISYDPRPLIKITPPASSTDRRTKVYFQHFSLIRLQRGIFLFPFGFDFVL